MHKRSPWHSYFQMLQKEKRTFNLHQILTKLMLTPMKNSRMQTTPRAHACRLCLPHQILLTARDSLIVISPYHPTQLKNPCSLRTFLTLSTWPAQTQIFKTFTQSRLFYAISTNGGTPLLVDLAKLAHAIHALSPWLCHAPLHTACKGTNRSPVVARLFPPSGSDTKLKLEELIHTTQNVFIA